MHGISDGPGAVFCFGARAGIGGLQCLADIRRAD